MGILNLFSPAEKKRVRRSTRAAMKEARRGDGAAAQSDGGALQSLVESFRDIGLDGRFGYASAADVARRAQKAAGKGRPEKAIKRLIRQHRRGVGVAGFATGLGGFITLPVLLPANIFEFYVQATRLVGGIAAVRGYDLNDEEVRVRVLAALTGEEAGDVLGSLGLGPIAGVAARGVASRMRRGSSSQIAQAIGSRIMRRFALRSTRLFGKAIPGLGAVVGAISDRRQLAKIAEAALTSFPAKG